MRRIIWILLFVWLFIVLGGGKAIDNVCVKGKLKERHVMAVTAVGWKKRLVEAGDRIVDRRCSEFLRKITFRDSNALDPYRWEN